MKLNDSNFDQASFSHKRVILSMLWLRSKYFVPNELKTSFRDILFVYLGHYHSELIPKVKRIIGRITVKLQGSNRD